MQIILLGVWAILLFGGAIFGGGQAGREGRMPLWTRLGSSLALVLFAWALWLSSGESESAGFTLLLAVGMTLGFIGDLFMAEVLPVRAYVFGGIAAFGLGHIAYIIAALSEGSRSGIAWDGGRITALTGGWVFAALAWWEIVSRPAKRRTALHWAALPYALLLGTTAGIGIGLSFSDGRFLSLAFGGILFLISDLILAARLFNNLTFRRVDDVIWLTYGPAQALIVLTGWLSLAV